MTWKSRAALATVGAIAVVTLSTEVIAANLLTNGSFESFTTAGSPGESLLAPGATNLTGWTVIGGHDLLLCGPGGCGTGASDGSYFLDLTGITNVAPYAGVSQTINTILGKQYQLSFDMGGRYDSLVSTVLATAGASSQSFTTDATNFPNPSTYTTETLNFIGVGGPTTVSLLGTFNSGVDLSLDNVIMTGPSAVPEPANWALMLIGFGGLGATMRARRRSILPATCLPDG